MHQGTFIAPLHGLRGIAAVAVLVAHSVDFAGLPLPDLTGGMGVMLFFALSGFLMAHLYFPQKPDREALTRYALARFGRVYPLFALVCVFAFLMHYLVSPNFPYSMFFLNLLVHLAGLGASETIWTISTELQFYAVFVLLWIAYPQLGEHRRYWMIAGCFGVIALLWLLGFPGNRIAITGYLQVFLGGVLVALCLPLIKTAKLELVVGWLLPVLLIGFVAAMAVAPHTIGGRWVYHDIGLIALVSFIVLSAVLAPTSPTASILSARPLHWLGEVSFGVYLLHRPAMFFVDQFLPSEAHWALKMLCLLLLVGAAAQLALVLIERPARSWVRSWPIGGAKEKIASVA